MKEYRGYTVYDKEGKSWIVGFETEEKAKAQIDSLVEQEENATQEKTKLEQLEAQVTDLQLALAELVEGGIENG